MTEILYSGLKEEYLNEIRYWLKNALFTSLSLNQKQLLDNKTKDALIIGEEISNPIRLAQEAYAADSCLSILIISERDHYKKLKQALLFTPFIGNTVECVSEGGDKTLAETIVKLIERTKQKRNYQILKRASVPLYMPLNTEQLKQEYINKFFEEAPVGALLLNQDSTILALNKQAINLFQHSEKELLGSAVESFFPAFLQKEVKDFIDRQYHSLARKVFKDNNNLFLELSISEARVQTNVIYKILMVADLSDKTLNDEKIQLQLLELKRINTDLDTFVYTASHDLKAPISNIEGLVYTLKDIVNSGNLNPKEIMELLEFIEKSILKFKGTINDLADVTKLQRDIDAIPELINIGAEIAEVLATISSDITASSATIHVDSHCGSIKFPKVNFKSIFYNLLSNAIKYRSLERALVIDVSCKKTQEYIMIEVKDNGLGVSERNRQKMFGMFKRFHDHVEGTGIGLYIVKRIVDNAGGKIEVESEVNKGTTFKVYFKSN